MRCAFLYLIAVAVCPLMAVAETTSMSPGGAYDDFASSTLKYFAASAEPLTTKIPGEKFTMIDDGAWQRVSEDSATLAFETTLPATSYIEYGPTTQYGSKTEPTDRPYYIHVHTLKGLKTGQPVHYRFVAKDDRGQTTMSADKTITPKKIANAIYLTSDKPTPIKLDKAGATYVLKSDIVAPGTALSVTATDVTIDLNGYTVTYNNVAGGSDAAGTEFGALASQGQQGVRCSYGTRGSTKLYNGTIKQGAGNGGYGYVPVIYRGAEIAGVTLDYYGPQVSGIDNECKEVHHNVIIDRGTELTNRHQGVQGVGVSGNVHHNLFKRVRQRGVNAASGSKIYRNEIYVDSCTTNSFGIMFYKTRKCEATDNRVFGTGYLAIGIGTVSDGVGDIKILRNFIQMQSHAPDNRWKEYGEQSGAYCVRVTWGGENVEYADNVLVSKGRDGGMVRGVWFCPGPKISNVSFRNNTIKVISETPDTTDKWGAIVVSGEDNPDSKPGLFENNTIISNFCNVRLGEEYGTGKNARFVNNTFVRDGDFAKYATVVCGFHTFNNNGSVFLDSKLENGASFDKVRWEGTGDNSFSVGKTAGGSDTIEKTYKPSGAQQ
jgi:hypothetical protein